MWVDTRWTYKHILSLNEGFLPVKRSSFQSCEHLKSWPSVKRSNIWFSTRMLVCYPTSTLHPPDIIHMMNDEYFPFIHCSHSSASVYYYEYQWKKEAWGMRLILLSWHCPLLRKAEVLLNDFTPTYRYPVLILPSDLGWFGTPHLCSVICRETNSYYLKL